MMRRLSFEREMVRLSDRRHFATVAGEPSREGEWLASVEIRGAIASPDPLEDVMADTIDRQPNLLFVFADQMRAQDCGFMRPPVEQHLGDSVRTPHLDQMADEGVVFTNAVSSCPICTPYRASLLTGRYPLTLGMVQNDVRLSTAETGIAHVLQDQGYHTGYVGKWHLDGQYRGGFTPPGPRRQGFEQWRVADCNHNYMNGYYYADDPEPVMMEGYDADWQTDQTIEYVQTHAHEPFCAFLSWGPPHNPCWVMPEEYMIYSAEDVALRANVPAELSEQAAQEIAGYWCHIAALDRNIGRLMAALDEAGIAEDTIVVFTSDHGDILGSHGHQRKQKPWEESLMVPFVMRWPGHTPAGLRSDTLINAPDIMPTLLSLLDAPIPDAVEGLDLSHAALGQPGDEPTSAFIGNPCPFHGDAGGLPEWRGVRTKTHTYVRGLDGPMMLYDNAADPYQLENLIGNAEAGETLESLDDELGDWLARLDDDFATKETYIERFNYEVDARGIVPYVGEIGLSDLDGARTDGTRRVALR